MIVQPFLLSSSSVFDNPNLGSSLIHVHGINSRSSSSRLFLLLNRSWKDDWAVLSVRIWLVALKLMQVCGFSSRLDLKNSKELVK